MSIFAHYDAHGLPATCEEVERVRSITSQIPHDADAEMTRLRAELARAQQATAEARREERTRITGWLRRWSKANEEAGRAGVAYSLVMAAWKVDRLPEDESLDVLVHDSPDCACHTVADWSPLRAQILAACPLHGEALGDDVPATPTECGSCGGDTWVDDQNWQPEDYERARGRAIGSGRIPCGICNHGGWNVPDFKTTAAIACGPGQISEDPARQEAGAE